MALVFLGGEVPSHRNLLIASGVKHIGVNYWRLKRRGLPKHKDYLLSEKYPEDVKIYVDGGALQASEANLSRMELEQLAGEYHEWVALNEERIHAATEFDSLTLGPAWIQTQRSEFWSTVTCDMWPVWHPDYGHLELFRLADHYEHIAIPGSAIEGDVTLAARARTLSVQYGTKLHGLAVAKPDNLRQIPFVTASTLSWVSPMMRGETIVWDGRQLVRYPKKMKDQARPRYKHVIDKAGLDFQKVLADDPNEVTRLAIWSYLELEKSLDKKNERPELKVVSEDSLLSDNSGAMDDPGFAETLGVPPDNSDIEVRKHTPREVQVRDPREMQILPTFGVESRTIMDRDASGRDLITEAPVLKSSNVSLRQCDTCFVAANCPAFKPQNTCAFALPVEVKTKEQLKALLNAVIEMQGQRVAFARFSEELNGGYPDPNTSQEIDRLFKIVGKLKELEENREFIKMTVERQGGGGVLSQLFGERAQSLTELPNGGISQEATTRIISDSIEG